MWKLWAPLVSMAMMGTSPQPTSCSPWTTPHKRPPPPTDSAMAPGFAFSVSFSSFTMEVWPSLEGGGGTGSGLGPWGHWAGVLCHLSSGLVSSLTSSCQRLHLYLEAPVGPLAVPTDDSPEDTPHQGLCE